MNNVNVVAGNAFADRQMYEKELEARKNNLRETFSKCDVVKLENSADATTFVVSRDKSSDQFKVFCLVDNVPWSTREDTLEGLVDYFAKSNYVVSGKVEIDLEKDVLRATFVNKASIRDELLSHRMDWSGVDTKEKQRIQKIVGRARDKIRANGINWMSLRNVAMISVDTKGNIALAPLSNEDFARMCKSASRSWSATEKEGFVTAMNAIKDALIVPENGVAPNGVYLTKYRSSDDIHIETGKDILFNAKFRMQTPERMQQLGVVSTQEGKDAQYIESFVYLGDKQPKLHEEDFEELNSAAVRQPTEQERALIAMVQEYQPEMIEARGSDRDAR